MSTSVENLANFLGSLFSFDALLPLLFQCFSSFLSLECQECVLSLKGVVGILDHMETHGEVRLPLKASFHIIVPYLVKEGLFSHGLSIKESLSLRLCSLSVFEWMWVERLIFLIFRVFRKGNTVRVRST
jgi:hypothetical protein